MGFEPGFSIPTRQRCGVCHVVCILDFCVPDEMWKKAIPDYLRNERLCLWCFVSRADERHLPWDKEIELRPVSLYSQMEIQQRIKQE